MLDLLVSIAAAVASMFRSRRTQALEILALRQQLAVYKRTAKRPVLRAHERVFWVWPSRVWTGWRSALIIVKPETVIAWHRRGFLLYWTWRSRRRRSPGRPRVSREIRGVVRRVLHFGVTSHPSAEWSGNHVVQAFPLERAPRTMIRDRDAIYGEAFRRRLKHLGIEEVITAPMSLWQDPYAERLIGSVRRECIGHVIIMGERHLRALLRRYFAYYDRARTHLALGKDAPEPRPVQTVESGEVVSIPQVGGLHHRYERRAA